MSLKPHDKLYRGYALLMTPQLFHWSFSTIKLQVRVLATNVDFTDPLAKTQFFLLTNFLEHVFLSYLA